jgi:hypothetical protein
MNTVEQAAFLKGDKHMQPNRQAATLAGILFIIATVTAILGLYFYQPILTGPDYLLNGAANASRVMLGAFMELILVCTAIGTAIVLFPVLKPYGERLAFGHLLFRFLEAVIITVGIVAVLSLLTLSQDFVAAAAPDASAYHPAGTLLHAVYTWTSAFGPLIMLGINTLMYSYLLYKSKLVPRPLAALGLAGATLVFVAGLIVLFGIAPQLSISVIPLVLPIAAYEMILAVWLIVKGFNSSATASEPARTATNELLNPA